MSDLRGSDEIPRYRVHRYPVEYFVRTKSRALADAIPHEVGGWGLYTTERTCPNRGLWTNSSVGRGNAQGPDDVRVDPSIHPHESIFELNL